MKSSVFAAAPLPLSFCYEGCFPTNESMQGNTNILGVTLTFQIRSLIAAATGVAACLAVTRWFDVGKAGGLPVDMAFAWAAGGLGGVGIASFTEKSKVLGGCIGGGVVPTAYYCMTTSWNLVPYEWIAFQMFVFWASGTIGGAALSAIIGVVSEGVSPRARSADSGVSKPAMNVAEPSDATERRSRVF